MTKRAFAEREKQALVEAFYDVAENVINGNFIQKNDAGNLLAELMSKEDQLREKLAG